MSNDKNLSLQKKCNNARFHKNYTCSLHDSAATQLRWGDRFYSRYVACVRWSLLIVIVKTVKIGYQKPKILQE